MKLSDQQQLFTRNIAKLIRYAHEMGFGLTFGHAEVRSEVGELMAGTGVVAAAAMAGRSGALPSSGIARCASRH